MTTSAFVSASMSSPSASAPASAPISSIPTVPPYTPTDVHAALKQIHEFELLAYDLCRQIEAACPQPYTWEAHRDETGDPGPTFQGLQETDALAKAWQEAITVAADLREWMQEVARVTSLRAGVDDPYEEHTPNYQDKRPIEEIRAELFG